MGECQICKPKVVTGNEEQRAYIPPHWKYCYSCGRDLRLPAPRHYKCEVPDRIQEGWQFYYRFDKTTSAAKSWSRTQHAVLRAGHRWVIDGDDIETVELYGPVTVRPSREELPE